MALAPLGWFGIVRLGLVQTALGSIVVLTTATMNRVMVVELALPALVPGALVALHHLLQMCRPRFGHGSDVGGRRTPWIVGGVAVLALGAVGAAAAIAWMPPHPVAAMFLAVASFTAIGLGVGAAGTSLLVLLAKRVDPDRRGAAATIVWMMMIAGFVLTTTVAGHYLDPYSAQRLVVVTAVVCGLALLLAVLAVSGVEGPRDRSAATVPSAPAGPAKPSFRDALAQVWAEPQARRFTWFVFVSMLAYSAQDLILEPFAGTVFAYTPGATTKLSGVLHGGVLSGMALVAIVTSVPVLRRFGSLRAWMIGGCIASACVLSVLATAGFAGPGWPLRPVVFALGVGNGAFAVAAIGMMMHLAGAGRSAREGVRMGLWGAAQAIAFGCAGLVATGASDLARHLLSSTVSAYAAVFCGEALLFLWAAVIAVDAVRSESRGYASPFLARVIRPELDNGRTT